jgi:hypothetical protein
MYEEQVAGIVLVKRNNTSLYELIGFVLLHYRIARELPEKTTSDLETQNYSVNRTKINEPFKGHPKSVLSSLPCCDITIV